MSSLLGWFCASFVPVVLPQDPAPQPVPREASSRYVVRLTERGFDLASYAAAVRARRPADAQKTIAELEAAMRSDQAPVVEFVTRELGGRVLAQWWIVNGLAVELEASQVAHLRAHPRIAEVVPDQIRHAGRFIKTSTNAANHAADVVQAQGVRGRGAVLAIVDSGVDAKMGTTNRPHATFFVDGNVANTTGGGLSGSRLFANKQIGLMSPDDIIAHGTAVAGVAAGARWNQGPTADDGHAPLASIVSYAIADDLSGGTYATTLTTAWQAVAADRLVYGTNVAVCSYEGYYDWTFSDQEAIDVLAATGDMVVCGMAGNGGANSSFVYGSTNMLAVGAVQADTRVVAAFSALGPVILDPTRFYPDLVANGVGMRLPKADDEVNDKIGSGTSYSAPQVAGAALLYRSLRPLSNATEVHAAILATTEDVAGKNLQPPYDSRNAYGVGYLRDDLLVGLASGRGLVVSSNVTPTQRTRTFKFAVNAGQRYAVALTWFRQNTSAASWSNLDLAVKWGTQVLATGATPRNVHELVRFRAPLTGLVDIEVTSPSFESGLTNQPFSIAATESLAYWVKPQVRSFGTACPVAQPLTFGVLSGEPRVGTSYQLGLANARPLRPTLSLLGASSTTWLGNPLPLDLTPFGGPGCSVLASPDVTFPGVTNAFGIETYRFNVPSDPALVDVELYHQVFVGDPQANGLGAAVSSAIAARIGGG